jgi:predicted nucleic acid-binding Zn ribbon protein
MGGGAGLIFKGSGFYETDYKRSSTKKTDGADKPAKPAGETKPAPAAAAK